MYMNISMYAQCIKMYVKCIIRKRNNTNVIEIQYRCASGSECIREIGQTLRNLSHNIIIMKFTSSTIRHFC